MNIIISNTSKEPIYEQIKSQIKNSILKGELEEGDALPSMRTLAKELKISIITTKRAYEDLEKEGFISSFVGKGSFVASQNSELLREKRLQLIEEKMQEIIAESKHMNIELQQLLDMLSMLYEEEEA